MTRWEVINPHAAGIDVGATSHYVAVPPDSVADNEKNVRVFTGIPQKKRKVVGSLT